MRPERSVEGQLVRLDALDETHAGGPYLAWLADPHITRFLEVRFNRYDENRLRDYIKTENDRADAVLFGMFAATTSRLIGTIKLSNIHRQHRNCAVGLMIGDSSVWGKGYATEAIALACRYAFEVLGLHRVVAGCYATNVASARAFAKAGFVAEGRLRDDRLDGAEWVDTLLMARLNPAESPLS